MDKMSVNLIEFFKGCDFMKDPKLFFKPSEISNEKFHKTSILKPEEDVL